jgi:hypothetical protein
MGLWHICNRHACYHLAYLIVLYLNQRKALQEGPPLKQRSGRTVWQSINFYFWEFDGEHTSLQHVRILLITRSLVVDLLLVCAGFALFLLPFSPKTARHSCLIVSLLPPFGTFSLHPSTPSIPKELRSLKLLWGQSKIRKY